MTTLQYDSLPQRPPRASRRQKLAPVVGMEEEEKTGGGRGGEGRGAGGGGDEEMTAAATTTKVNNASASAAAADRPPSKHEGAAPAAAPAAVTPRGHLERSRAKRARQGEDREEEEEEDGMEREQADNGGVSTYPASTSSSFSRTPAVPGFDFEYLDHTADIQIHSWGTSLEAAFCSAGLGMVNYMTPLEGLAAVEECRFSASGHDLDTLLFSFLDELLFAFSTEGFAARELSILGGIDREKFSLEAVGKGEKFDREKHASGTEVKAITYSAMRIVEDTEREQKEADIWVIVDI